MLSLEAPDPLPVLTVATSMPNGLLELGPRPKGEEDVDDASDNPPPPGDESLRKQKERRGQDSENEAREEASAETPKQYFHNSPSRRESQKVKTDSTRRRSCRKSWAGGGGAGRRRKSSSWWKWKRGKGTRGLCRRRLLGSNSLGWRLSLLGGGSSWLGSGLLVAVVAAATTAVVFVTARGLGGSFLHHGGSLEGKKRSVVALRMKLCAVLDAKMRRRQFQSAADVAGTKATRPT